MGPSVLALNDGSGLTVDWDEEETASNPDWEHQFTPKQSQSLDTEFKQGHEEEQGWRHAGLEEETAH